VVTRGASIVRHSSAADGRVRVSLHLEKQGLTDVEVQLLVAWYKVSEAHDHGQCVFGGCV